jgi:hypothetical protein
MAELGWKFWLTMTSVVLVILLALGLGRLLIGWALSRVATPAMMEVLSPLFKWILFAYPRGSLWTI